MISVQPRLAGIKSLNRLDQVLARQEWRSEDPWEGLMLDPDGHIICGTMSNVFFVHDNRISTPRLDRAGVAGIMRRHVIELLDADSIRVEEKRLTTADLDSADEVFLTNSQVGAVPVSKIGERTLSPDAETRRVMDLLAGNGVPECAP
jgi:4-amino-4-deoxychorismate lyase